MQSKAAVVRIIKSKEFGKIGRVVAECESYFVADLLVTGLERADLDCKLPYTIGYMAIRNEHLNHAATSYGFKLEK
ncbi:hypothetical protein KMI8_58 [Klebsiella phage KMI8]|nr:hypothetical protein KMI8_58 [Klebsiella phage KMI8]